MNHYIPSEWILEAGLQSFEPSASGYHCDVPHTLVALEEIKPARRNEGVTLDSNGFNRERMMRVLTGIRHGEPIPPILVWPAETGPWRFELRDGFHRFYAAQTLKFSHVPADIIERY